MKYFSDCGSYWKDRYKNKKSKADHLQSQLDAALSQNYQYQHQIERLNNAIDEIARQTSSFTARKDSAGGYSPCSLVRYN